jgi:hypothetical protein
MSLTKVSYSMITGAPVNVLDFGANTTPGTTSMSAAFQAAIDSLASTGGTIFIPKGTYYIPTTLTLSNSYITFIGEGADYTSKGTILVGTVSGPSPMFNLVTPGMEVINFRDLTISSCSIGVKVPANTYVSNINFSNVKFLSISSTAVQFAGSLNDGTEGVVGSTFNNCVFYDCFSGIVSQDGVMVNNTHVSQCFSGSPRDGGNWIYLGDCIYSGSNSIRDSYDNGTATTTHIPFSFGYGAVILDNVNFADFNLTPGTNDGYPLITVRKSSLGSYPNIPYIILKNIEATNFRGAIIAITNLAVLSKLSMADSLLISGTGYPIVSYAQGAQSLSVNNCSYIGGLLQNNSTNLTWNSNSGNVSYFPLNANKGLGQGYIPITYTSTSVAIANNTYAGMTWVMTTAASALAFDLCPAAYIPSGGTFVVKKQDSGAGAITINRAGSDLIDGATTKVLATQGKFATLISNGVDGWTSIAN